MKSRSSAIASIVTAGAYSFPWYWSCYAVEYLFHNHLQQSINPIIPKNFKVLPYCRSVLSCAFDGGRRYLFLNEASTIFANFFIHCNAVKLGNQKYSSLVSLHVPHAIRCFVYFQCSSNSGRPQQLLQFWKHLLSFFSMPRVYTNSLRSSQ